MGKEEICIELLETERSYVNSLRGIINVRTN